MTDFSTSPVPELVSQSFQGKRLWLESVVPAAFCFILEGYRHSCMPGFKICCAHSLLGEQKQMNEVLIDWKTNQNELKNRIDVTIDLQTSRGLPASTGLSRVLRILSKPHWLNWVHGWGCRNVCRVGIWIALKSKQFPHELFSPDKIV